MAVTVETLEKLERKITADAADWTLSSRGGSRPRKLARTVKMDGFRPGKGAHERGGAALRLFRALRSDERQGGEAFASAANEAQLRVAGQPRITEKKEGAPEGRWV